MLRSIQKGHTSSSILCFHENSFSNFAQAQFLHSEPRVKILYIAVIRVVLCYTRKGYTSSCCSLSQNVRFPVKEKVAKESIRNADVRPIARQRPTRSHLFFFPQGVQPCLPVHGRRLTSAWLHRNLKDIRSPDRIACQSLDGAASMSAPDAPDAGCWR